MTATTASPVRHFRPAYYSVLPPRTRLVTRGSRWGNRVSWPEIHGDPASHLAAVAVYREWALAPAQKAWRALVRRRGVLRRLLDGGMSPARFSWQGQWYDPGDGSPAPGTEASGPELA